MFRSKEEKVMGYSAPYWYFVTWKYFEIFPSGERKIRTTGWLNPWISFRKRKPTDWVNLSNAFPIAREKFPSLLREGGSGGLDIVLPDIPGFLRGVRLVETDGDHPVILARPTVSRGRAWERPLSMRGQTCSQV